MFMPVVQVWPMGMAVFQRGVGVLVTVAACFSNVINVDMVMVLVRVRMVVGVSDCFMIVGMLVGLPE
jgi:hypothetical protein